MIVVDHNKEPTLKTAVINHKQGRDNHQRLKCSEWDSMTQSKN